MSAIRKILEDNLVAGIAMDGSVQVQGIEQAEAAIINWAAQVIGGDLPMIQPLDNEMDPIQYEGHRMFRKGANWTKGEQRKRAFDE